MSSLPLQVLQAHLHLVAFMLAAQSISPLRTLSYPLAAVATALRALAQAAHVGKVVAYTPPTAAPVGPTHGSALSRARVLITGGTGGLGLLVARWLVGCGSVGHLHLVSRRGRTADEAQRLADLLLENGCRTSVTLQALDVAAAEDAQALWQQGGNSDGGDVGCWDAVLHASGVLADAMLPRQTLSGVRQVRGFRCVEGLPSIFEGNNCDTFIIFHVHVIDLISECCLLDENRPLCGSGTVLLCAVYA